MNQLRLRKYIGAIFRAVVRTFDALASSHVSGAASAEVIAPRSVPLKIREQAGRARPSLWHFSSASVLLTVLFVGVASYAGIRLTGAVADGRRLDSAEPALRKLRTELSQSRRAAAMYRSNGGTENVNLIAGNPDEIEKMLGQLRISFSSDPGVQGMYDQFVLSWDQSRSLAAANMHATALQASALSTLCQNAASASGFLQPAAVETYAARNPPTLASRVSAAGRIDANIREMCHLTEQLAATQVAGPEATPEENIATANVREYVSCIHQLGRSFRTLIFAQNETMAGNWERCWRQAAAASEDTIRLSGERRELSRRLALALETTDQLITAQLEPYRLTRLGENARSVRQMLAWIATLVVIWVSTLFCTNCLRRQWLFFRQLRPV